MLHKLKYFINCTPPNLSVNHKSSKVFISLPVREEFHLCESGMRAQHTGADWRCLQELPSNSYKPSFNLPVFQLFLLLWNNYNAATALAHKRSSESGIFVYDSSYLLLPRTLLRNVLTKICHKKTHFLCTVFPAHICKMSASNLNNSTIINFVSYSITLL